MPVMLIGLCLGGMAACAKVLVEKAPGDLRITIIDQGFIADAHADRQHRNAMLLQKFAWKIASRIHHDTDAHGCPRAGTLHSGKMPLKNAEVGSANPFKPPGVKASADRCRGGALDWACDFAQSYHEVRRQSILRCSEDHRRTRFEDGRMGDASSLH
jgi:hypothetical protein